MKDCAGKVISIGDNISVDIADPNGELRSGVVVGFEFDKAPQHGSDGCVLYKTEGSEHTLYAADYEVEVV